MILGGQYKILSEMGAGGMGVVYQAVDVMLEREVAIKRLRNEFSSTPDVAERFRREAKIQARLNHRNIAHLYSFFKDGDSFYIVMEFVNGAPLSSLLPLPWERALAIFLQILDSLEYAHSLGVLHRDLKPDNIMVSPRGEVKVMDFGIAHVLGQTRQTREKSIVGTLEYVPPELILGHAIDQRSDIYSLGILLFEMIGGRVPFESKVEFEILRQHLEAQPPTLASVTAGVPGFVSEAVARALVKDPAGRFASCADMTSFLKERMPAQTPAAVDTGVRQTQTGEVERCVRRIGSLLAGGETDVAALVLESALSDYPADSRLLACETRIEDEKKKRAASIQEDQKTAFLRETFRQLSELESRGDIAGCLGAGEKALSRYPKVLALKVALAYFRRLQAEASSESAAG
jgi:serine/threonine-protein kinase